MQVSHLDNVCPICFSFLARHAKSSALLGRSACTGLMFQRGLMFHKGLMFQRGLMFQTRGLMFHPRGLMFQRAYVPNGLMFRRNGKENEQYPRICSIRRGIARFVFSFLRARVPSVSNARGPYVQAAAQGGARGAGTPPGEGGQTQVLAQTCVRKKWGPILSPGGRDHGHKILVRETAVSFESLS